MSPAHALGRVALFFASALFLVGTPAVGQPSAALTQKDIEAAIDWGTFGEPAPYWLRCVNVYTPFVRVAIAAKAARDTNRAFTADDVVPDLIKPIAYVTFRVAPCACEQGTEGSDRVLETLSEYTVAVPGIPELGDLPLAMPLWVRQDVSSVLSSFGAALPSCDVAFIAAYPMTALESGRYFVLFRRIRTPQGTSTGAIGGIITAEDLAQWR
jgi:hypothetical protein